MSYGNVVEGAFERGKAARAEGVVESEVGLVAADEIAGGVDDLLVEVEDGIGFGADAGGATAAGSESSPTQTSELFLEIAWFHFSVKLKLIFCSF